MGGDTDEHRRLGAGGGMAPSRPRPLGTWRLQYSNTMYTWSRSAKCPWKATMLRCRRQLCRAISLSTCGRGPTCTHPAGAHTRGTHAPTGVLPTPRAGTSLRTRFGHRAPGH